MEKMPRNSNALKHDGSMMADSDFVDFLSRSTDSSINFSGSADLHTPIHPPLSGVSGVYVSSVQTKLEVGIVDKFTQSRVILQRSNTLSVGETINQKKIESNDMVRGNDGSTRMKPLGAQ